MWFIIIGLLIGALVAWYVVDSIYNKRSFKWWEIVIAAVGVLLLAFTIQNFIGSIAEEEIKPAMMFLATTGVLSIILIVLAWQLNLRRNKGARS